MQTTNINWPKVLQSVLKPCFSPRCFFPLCNFLQKTIGQILASMEIFSRFETILEVNVCVSAPGRCGSAAVADSAAGFMGILSNI